MYTSLDQQTYIIDIELCKPNFAGCYLVQDEGELALIDCGTAHSLSMVLQTITDIGFTPEQVRWIIPTHIHLDHAGGAGHLMQACKNAKLAVHPKGLAHMIDPSKLQAGATAVYGKDVFLRDYDELLPILADRCIAAGEGQIFELGKRTLKFIHTPGHANHHGSIYDSRSGYLFTGDTFGLGYRELAKPSPYLVATTSPVAFDPEAWYESLERMTALEPSAICVTHFGKYTYSPSMYTQLVSSIRAHQEIALGEEKNTEEGRYERLLSAVENYLLEDAKKKFDLPEEEVRNQLRHDIALNAQGLEIWLARRAKMKN